MGLGVMVNAVVCQFIVIDMRARSSSLGVPHTFMMRISWSISSEVDC